MRFTRITYYQDPLNDHDWIIAADAGDPSMEHVLDSAESEEEAILLANREAERRGLGEPEYVPCNLL